MPFRQTFEEALYLIENNGTVDEFAAKLVSQVGEHMATAVPPYVPAAVSTEPDPSEADGAST